MPVHYTSWYPAVTLAFVALTVCRVHGADSTLTAAFVNSTQEAQFSTTDGILSAFWSGWGGNDSLLLAQGTHDHLVRNTWEGPDDARVSVKVAAGEQGQIGRAHV